MSEYSMLRLKRGTTPNFSTNLVGSNNEPVWSLDDGYNRLFITNGTAASPTIVNPVVRYNEYNIDSFPWNKLASDKGYSENPYMIFPMVFCSNNRDDNFISSYKFTSIAINITLNDDISWYSYRIRIQYSGNWYDIGTELSPIPIQSGVYQITVNNGDFASFSFTLSQLYSSVSLRTANVFFVLTDTIGNTYNFQIYDGEYGYTRPIFIDSSFEGNMASVSIGKDCMEVGCNNAMNVRIRPLLSGASYFTNTTDNVSFSPQASGISESNISIGSGSRIGTLTFGGGYSQTGKEYSTTIIPPVVSQDNSVVAVLPQKSGKLAVFEQSNTGDCKYIAVADSTNDRLNHINSLPNDGTTQMLVGNRLGQSVSYGWMNIISTVPISTTYSNLKNLFDNDSLEPGKLYRITDYVATTTQQNTISVNSTNLIQNYHNSFDLIVLATSTSTLDCHAMAVLHAGDTYFSESGNTCDLSKWQIWYDINNDTNKYAWADAGESVTVGANQELRVYKTDPDVDHNVDINEYFVYVGTMDIEGSSYYLWRKIETNPQTQFHIVTPYYIATDVLFAPNSLSLNNYGTVKYGLIADGSSLSINYDENTFANTKKDLLIQCSIDTKTTGSGSLSDFSYYTREPGKGIIYRMIDDLGNDCPYDFKNIQFLRPLTNGAYDPSGTDTWVYTFSKYDNGTIKDSTLVFNRFNQNVKWNTQKENIIEGKITLNNNVFIGSYFSYNTLQFSCRNNTFETRCNHNVLGNNCYSNSFGDSCSSNSFGENCNRNTFGSRCSYNTFGANCSSNTFEYGCQYNTFGDSCYDNDFEYGCQSNTFENNFYKNTITNQCYGNTFGDRCHDNYLGNKSHDNLFGNGCHENIFGNPCDGNTFGNNCYSNSFGNACSSNSFGENCNGNTFGASCSSNSFGENCNGNTFGASCSSNTFGCGCHNITLGNLNSQGSDDSSDGSSELPFNTEFIKNVFIESDNSYITIYQTIYQNDYLQYIKIHSGTNTTATPLILDSISRGNTYMTTVARNSSGTVIAWCEADNIMPIMTI